MTEPIEHTMAEEFMAEGFYTKAALVELIIRARDLGPWRTDWENAPKDKPIVGLCSHSAAPYTEDADRLTPYGAHTEFLPHVEDGPNVLEWGGEYEEDGRRIPAWWFLRGVEFEVVAYPTHWMLLPAQEPGQ